MSLKDLEKHQNINKRDWDNWYVRLSLKQQEKEKQEQLERRKNFKAKRDPKLDKSKFTWSNTYKDYIANDEFTDELEEKEIEFTPYI
jgi:hypothetical protein